VVHSNGVCFLFKKAQCIPEINFPENLPFFKGNVLFWEINSALWKGGRLEKCLELVLRYYIFSVCFYRFLIEWY